MYPNEPEPDPPEHRYGFSPWTVVAECPDILNNPV